MAKIDLKNELKDKMNNGEQVLGTFHGIGSSSAVEIEAYAGMDYIIIDSEHGPFGVEKTQEFIRAAKLSGTTPLVRVKDGERNSILKMLDVGAMGLIIPNVKTIDEVEKIVNYGKYYPVGNRGVAATNGSHFWSQEYAQQGLEHYFEVANNEQLLIPQCETVECLENIEEITQIDGVDGIFIGPFDLSTAMGIPGQFDHPDFIEAIDRILKACQKANVFSFVYAPNVDTAKQRLNQGFQSITYSMDTALYLDALKNIVSEIKG